MARNRLTEEQAIEKYGSIERYHRHLANVKKYADSHKLEAKLYREHHLNEAIERSRKWRKEHIEEYKEKMRESNRRRYREDPLFRQFVHARHYASITLDRLDLKRPDFLILHCFGALGNTFMYLHKEEHCMIRRHIRDRKKCYFDQILEHPEYISSAYIIVDGKLSTILRGTRKGGVELKWPFHTKKSSVTCKTMLRNCRKGYSFDQKSALEAVKSLTLSNPKVVEKRS